MTQSQRTNESILADIVSTIERDFGLRSLAAEQNHLGYLNLKWRLETDGGPVFVKQYDPVRYPAHRLPDVERTLSFQQVLHEQGIPCPAVYVKEGRSIQQTPAGDCFVVMSFSPGAGVRAGEVSESQMRSLGDVTGRMHRALNQGAGSRPPLHWQVPGREELLRNWSARREQAEAAQDAAVMQALERQRQIIEQFDFGWVSAAEPGWAHWDLWVDNLLFSPDGVAAILDFDRLRFIYPDMDIGRAILSGALKDGILRMAAVEAFVQGYRQHGTWRRGQLVRALRLLWCLELVWVRPFEPDDRNVLRFREEITWLESRWADLEANFGDL